MVPHELGFSDLYITPIIPALFLAFFAASITVIIFNKLKISHLFIAQPLAFLAIMTLYTLAIDAWVIHL